MRLLDQVENHSLLECRDDRKLVWSPTPKSTLNRM